MYVFVNVAMVMGAIPVGGVPLPLVSPWRLGDDHGDDRLRRADVLTYVHRDVEFGEGRDD